MSHLRIGALLLVLAAAVAPVAMGYGHGEGAESSPLLDEGASWSRTFGDAGTFAYHCHPHPEMEGRVVVADDAPEGDATVEIADMAFAPAEVRVRPGATVTWTNRDALVHTATFEGDGHAHGHGVPAPGLAAVLLVGAAAALALARRR